MHLPLKNTIFCSLGYVSLHPCWQVQNLTLPHISNKYFVTYFCQVLDLLEKVTDKNANCFKGLDLLFPAKSQGANKYHLDYLATLGLQHDILNRIPCAPQSHKAQDEGSCSFLGVCYKYSFPAPIAITGKIPADAEGIVLELARIMLPSCSCQRRKYTTVCQCFPPVHYILTGFESLPGMH